MYPQIRKLWTTALLSEEYVQGRGQLRRTGVERVEHCCLGVLCELYMQETGKGCWDAGFFYADYEDWDLYLLPEAVIEWAGLEDANPYIEHGFHLSDFNDGDNNYDLRRHSFPEIAQLINDHL